MKTENAEKKWMLTFDFQDEKENSLKRENVFFPSYLTEEELYREAEKLKEKKFAECMINDCVTIVIL